VVVVVRVPVVLEMAALVVALLMAVLLVLVLALLVKDTRVEEQLPPQIMVVVVVAVQDHLVFLQLLQDNYPEATAGRQ
jgi:xanthine/uracil permease